MPHEKKLLIVDSLGQYEGVYATLEDAYEIENVDNSENAIQRLRQHSGDFALVLLEITPPETDGYEFLQRLRNDPALSAVPALALISGDSDAERIRCLSSGALGVVVKPCNPEVLRHQVAAVLRLGEAAVTVNYLEFDHITGLYSKEFFYQLVKKTLKEHPERQYDILCSNVENFKLINERYGLEKGDELLRFLADRYRAKMREGDVCTRIGSDVFALFGERRDRGLNEEVIAVRGEEAKGCPIPNLVLKFGVYENVDHTLPVAGMCDRAIMALHGIKKQYGQHLAVYDDSLRLSMLRKQRLLDDMERALVEKQFKIYYQPKHAVKTGMVSGAEALVRWAHPHFGFLPSGEFIPLFEDNGFIVKLDLYILEEVCAVLKDWKARGLPLYPISVNVSRVDFNVPGLARHIGGVADRYGVEHELLHMEITESAYTKDSQQIVEVINDLRRMGFKIEMDDFGTGYSSLNMLSELPLDVLKIDMGFIKRETTCNRSSVLSFIVSLAKWLRLESVAEGVETNEQVENLKNMGCDYIQGYILAKPMPREEFETYCLQKREQFLKAREAGNGEVAEKEEGGHKPAILVVEDQLVNRQVLCAMLQKRYYVIEMTNGQEALLYLRENDKAVSAILLDLQMPVMDGYQVLSLLKQDEVLSYIPVIITSAGDADHELRALQLGADSFVTKPYQEKLLHYHLEKAVERCELQRRNEKLERRQKALRHEAFRDALTGVLNRKGLFEAVRQLTPGEQHAVFIMDIDNLKHCNDTYGHICGDELICMIAKGLQSDARDGDILARIGGDEFVIVAKNLSEPLNALKKGKRICENIKSLVLQKYDFHCSCSAGVVIMKDPKRFIETYRRADIALYQAKREAKGECRLWLDEAQDGASNPTGLG